MWIKFPRQQSAELVWGGCTIEGEEWITYDKKNVDTEAYAYKLSLKPSAANFPTSLPRTKTITITNKQDPTKTATVNINFTEVNAWLVTTPSSSEYTENTSSGYRIKTSGGTMTVALYTMFAVPVLTSSYDGTYCSSTSNGTSWLTFVQTKSETVGNRKKYTFSIKIAASQGTDAAYQLHKADAYIKQGGTNAQIQKYTIWRGASYYGYQVNTASGSGSSYYTAIRKGGYWWAPVNLGAIRVATKGHNGTNETGNYYQWGRRDATNPGCRTYNGVSTVTTPDDNIFYTGEKSHWLNIADMSLWQNGKNDPCPSGYRVPTGAEMKSWGSCSSESNGLYLINADSGFPQLVFPRTGRKMYANASMDGGSYTFIWSSTVVSGDYAKSYNYSGISSLRENDDYHSFGFVIRCIRK